MKLNKQKAFAQVGGRLPLFYMQDGHGFNRNEEYLGEYDAQGEKIADALVVTGDTGDQSGSGDDAGDLAPNDPVDTADSGDPDPQPTEPEAPVAEEPYKGVKAATMKRELEARGIDFEPNASRDDLVALLVADDKAKSNA